MRFRCVPRKSFFRPVEFNALRCLPLKRAERRRARSTVVPKRDRGVGDRTWKIVRWQTEEKQGYFWNSAGRTGRKEETHGGRRPNGNWMKL